MTEVQEMLEMEEDVSASISVRNIGNEMRTSYLIPTLDFLEAHGEDIGNDAKESLEDFVVNIKSIGSQLLTFGGDEKLSRFEVLATLNRIKPTFAIQVDRLVDEIPSKFNDKVSDEVISKYEKNAVFFLEYDFVSQFDKSGIRRNERLNELLSTKSLSKWGQVFRREDEWSNSKIISAHKTSIQKIKDSVQMQPSASVDKFIEKVSDKILNMLDEDMNEVVRTMLKPQPINAQLQSKIPEVIDFTLKKLDKQLEEFYEED